MVTFVRFESTRSPAAGAALAALRSPDYVSKDSFSTSVLRDGKAKGKRIYLRFDDCEIFLRLDQVEDERIDSGEDKGKEESESVEVEVALCAMFSGGNQYSVQTEEIRTPRMKRTSKEFSTSVVSLRPQVGLDSTLLVHAISFEGSTTSVSLKLDRPKFDENARLTLPSHVES